MPEDVPPRQTIALPRGCWCGSTSEYVVGTSRRRGPKLQARSAVSGYKGGVATQIGRRRRAKLHAVDTKADPYLLRIWRSHLP